MRLKTLPLAAALLVVSGAALAQPHAVDVDTCLNVREDHDTSATSLACLANGAQVNVIDSVPFWRRIEFGGPEPGWAAKRHLRLLDTPSDCGSDPTVPDDGFLEVHFVDVGQGDAAWIRTHDDGIDGNGCFEGINAVLDGGPHSSDNSNTFRPYLEDQGHHGAIIDALILTHPHTDHYRRADPIARHFDVQHYYDPGFASEALEGGSAFTVDSCQPASRSTGGPRS